MIQKDDLAEGMLGLALAQPAHDVRPLVLKNGRAEDAPHKQSYRLGVWPRRLLRDCGANDVDVFGDRVRKNEGRALEPPSLRGRSAARPYFEAPSRNAAIQLPNTRSSVPKYTTSTAASS